MEETGTKRSVRGINSSAWDMTTPVVSTLFPKTQRWDEQLIPDVQPLQTLGWGLGTRRRNSLLESPGLWLKPQAFRGSSCFTAQL